jgi:hypothetical protein
MLDLVGLYHEIVKKNVVHVQDQYGLCTIARAL